MAKTHYYAPVAIEMGHRMPKDLPKDLRNKTYAGKYESNKSDRFPVRYCPECDQCWQISGSKLEYLADFPKLGQKAELCRKCKDDKTDYILEQSLRMSGYYKKQKAAG